MKLSNFDINLLATLHVVLAEGSITRAAKLLKPPNRLSRNPIGVLCRGAAHGRHRVVPSAGVAPARRAVAR